MKIIKLIPRLLVFSLFVFSFIASSTNNDSGQGNSNNTNPKYSLLKIFVTDQEDMKNIMREGLFIDHAESHEGLYIETWLSEAEIEKLNRSGVAYEIVVPDFKEYYNSQPKMTAAEMTDAIQKSAQENNVTHSIYGSMGGFLTFDQVINKLDSMRIEYPGLISEKFSIGDSHEGRQQWTVRVSNSPNAPTGRPEVWFHSLIHAREPMSMEQNIYFMYWLLENYNIDPIATYLMNNREFYFTPVFNPDGYEYNRSTNPNGGGFWRKNRKQNTGGSFGIDLNRNFGIYAFWNSINNGSSTDPTDDTYRGTSPFSEVETQNARDFVISRNFKGILSYHTYGNYLIRPWGYVDEPSPDENIFQSFSQDMVMNNHFSLGRSNQTVAYGVRGVTDDWYYSDSAHASAIAMTPEVGTSTDGFWPLQSRILPLAKLTLAQNITFSLSCGPYVAPEKTLLNKEQYEQGEAGNLKVNFKNKGLMNAENVKIELTSQSPLVNIQTSAFSYPNIASFLKDSLAFNFTIGATTPLNSAIKTTLTVKEDNSNLVYSQDIYLPVGNGNILFLDSAENGVTKWTISSGWNTTTTQSYSPTRSFADSPTGNYPNASNRTMTLTTALNVSANPTVLLSFWYKHTIDTLDNAYVDVSNDNGATWQSVRFYNKTVSTWTKEVVDISQIASSTTTLKIRFSMVSNGTVVADGIYIDNIKLSGYNATPVGITQNTGIPGRYSLSQNYPNPFNPKTVINYQLSMTNFVSLKVFDVLGNQVATLVNEDQNPGNYSVSFDGNNLSSGLYYYKLESGEFTDTKKMLLIK
ncbi:MAG: M14 family zinc carboxypeptidase [Ignavibacteria bacterium]